MNLVGVGLEARFNKKVELKVIKFNQAMQSEDKKILINMVNKKQNRQIQQVYLK